MQVTPSKFEYVKLPGLDYELEVVTTSDSRLYVTPEGKKYPSASTISGVLNRDAIAAWRARVGVVEANKISKRGCDRGTSVHLIAEKYLLGTLTAQERMGMMPTLKELFLQLRGVFDTHIDVVYAIEQPLYSDRLRVAGRADGIVRWDGKLTILDTKTANKPKPEEWILNYFVQTAAYAEMLQERTGLEVDNIVIAMAVEGELLPTVYQKSKQEYLPMLESCLATYYKEHPEYA
jgi:genome maintenance exonuclease 1